MAVAQWGMLPPKTPVLMGRAWSLNLARYPMQDSQEGAAHCPEANGIHLFLAQADIVCFLGTRGESVPEEEQSARTLTGLSLS